MYTGHFKNVYVGKQYRPDEIPHYAAFHQDLHYLLRQKESSEEEIQYYLEIITGDPSIYTMDMQISFLILGQCLDVDVE